ncbi:exodeoxyribonuclease V subunit beta [Alteromonas sp. 345S023]|uniref:RecBCD enzyme subunit RecB n=1 Tax=Alteromonas profundi TaxID=2696062 RepID=A0A7X5LJR9_9ALTE|nr:exodeoxyribonuclease V subunit beta [Alteromonas profundi]NDV90652.1 exodeoxyribonuclease V subunit beta [Alteromonas profundi]
MTGAAHSQLLNVPEMPLSGRHLIEASAGTGKTFNITRLYLRLLLEKQLSVTQILVMTFTKAATEEIKGRIATTLREACTLWQQVKDKGEAMLEGVDPVYAHLFNTCDLDDALARLKAAQLELDEASVFTIHGFCQHVIGQLAFSSGFAMSLNLSKDTSELYLQAAEDWIRKVTSKTDGYREEDFLLLAAANWHVPERLLADFNSSIRSALTPMLLSEEDIERAFIADLEANPDTKHSQYQAFLHCIEENESLFWEQLIKTPAHKKERPDELAALKSWLRQCSEHGKYEAAPPLANKFLDGRRYARNKSGVKEILAPIKAFAKAIETAIEERDNGLAQVPVFTLVNEGITFIKQCVSKHKKQLGVIDFDDLITMLANEVVKPDNTLAAELRKKFPVALIDEFQDTDAKQYAILDAVYANANDAEGDNALMMIGDPKQAIYRFRGGDIFTYLKAGEQADYRWVMNTNWRSVAEMIKAYNRLFYGAPVAAGQPNEVFGFNIHYNPVEYTLKAAAAKHPLIDPHPSRSAMNYVSMHLDDKQDAATMRRNMAGWIAQEIYRLLNEASFAKAEQGSNATTPVRPADIAILVKDRTEASVIKQVLQQNGLACVYLSDRSNLFATAQAKDVLRLLNGIWHASDTSKVASSLASPLWGYSPRALVELLYHQDDALWDDAYERVLSLRDMWLQKGCMSVLLYLMQTHYQPLGNDVERALTNYQHLAEVLEKASTTHPRPEQLLDWLHKQIYQGGSDEEMTLRLESDSQLIRLITQHGSKGLEYPIVFVPYATGYKDPAKNGKSMAQIFTYYDEEKQDLQLQLGQTKKAIARVRAEGEAEDMRLAYVAVTRAAHRCYMGVIPLEGNEKSALARALSVQQGEDESRDWQTVLTQVAHEDEACAAHISADGFSVDYNAFSYDDQLPELQVQTFTGTDHENWRLYSFSAISRMAVQGKAAIVQQDVQSIPVIQTMRDEEMFTPEEITTHVEAVDQLRFTLAKGAAAGNLLHDILEINDFSAPNWDESGPELIKRFGLENEKAPLLYDWLEEVLHTPLSPHMGLALSDLKIEHTLREAEFYFPMQNSKWAELRTILGKHRVDVAAQLGVVAQSVPNLMTANLAGMMHGFIDLLFEYEGKYYVADYKSTWLGNEIASYSPAALFDNNQHHLYDLQYLIYCLALHRYLKRSLPGYEAETHLGGVYYLYLRGMHPENQQGEGVFYTPVPSALLAALDGVFDDKHEGGVQ